jgi:hypothetical protein
VIKKILDYLGIYEFKRDRPPHRKLAVADSFDDYRSDDYTDLRLYRFLGKLFFLS